MKKVEEPTEVTAANAQLRASKLLLNVLSRTDRISDAHFLLTASLALLIRVSFAADDRKNALEATRRVLEDFPAPTAEIEEILNTAYWAVRKTEIAKGASL